EQGVPPLSQEFARMYRQIDLGISLELVVRGAAERLQLVDFNVFASVVILHRTSGGNLPLLLDRLAVATRDRLHFDGQLRASTIMGRDSTGLIGGMTFLLLVYMLFFQTNFGTKMFLDVSVGYAGISLLITAVAFELIGVVLLFWLLK